MSAPSKITAIRHAVSVLHGAADDGADTRRYADALQGAGAELDELIEAVAQYRLSASTTNRLHVARLDAALARVKGGAA